MHRVLGWPTAGGLLCALAVSLVGAQSPGYHAAPLPVPAAGVAGFTRLPASATGLAFTNTLSPAHAAENQIRLNGSGVALGDVDGDGWCDVFVCALEQRGALFRNLGGWRFTNVTAAAGLDFPGRFSTGAVLADVDGDGDLDLILNGIDTGTRLFLNDGRGHFEAAPDAGLLPGRGPTTGALADIDGDGDLDLYVAHYRTNTVRSTGFALFNVGGRRMIRPQDRGHLELTPDGRVLEHGEPHVLYRNEGGGRFRPLSWTDGTFLDEDGQPLREPPRDWGLSAAFRDLNRDGLPDLYVCNDFHSPDRIWLNDGRGRFRALPRLALRHTATFSMAVDFADVDRDGHDDVFVSDMTSRDHGRRRMQIAGMAPYTILPGVYDDRPQLDRTVLQWNRGDGTYAEIATYAGLENSEWNWSVLFLDVDLDGYEDVLATTGHMFDTQDLDAQARIAAQGPYPPSRIPGKLLMLPPLEQANLAFRNQGNLTFVECSPAWGFDDVGVSQGMALADLDNDGDLDLVINNLNGPLGVYRNNAPAPRIAVRLQGQPPNTAGIGARITVRGGPVIQAQEMMAGGRYLSGDDPMRVFAAGHDTDPLAIEVLWRSGRRSVVTNARPNTRYTIHEPAGATEPSEPPPPPLQPPASSAASPFFEDISAWLDHRHHDDPFNDFDQQPLLPRRLSQLGPGLSWFDLDGDGREDLIVGSGKGGRLAVFRNRAPEGFQRLSEPPWNLPASRDRTALLGWHAPGRGPVLLVGSASYEADLDPGGAVLQFAPGEPQAAEVIPALPFSVGPLALADFDGDGFLDLFVGGRCLPGRYPEPPSSKLYRQAGGRWVLDVENSKRLERVGLVSGAVWTDLEGDGWPDLALAIEWGPIRLFRNERGRLSEWLAPVVSAPPGDATLNGQRSTSNVQRTTLNELTGWWNGIVTGDFDGDGLLDLLATNWGLNTVARASPTAPYRVYYGDFADTGAVHLIEATPSGPRGADVPERDLESVAAALPAVRARFPTHAAFGEATVADVLGPALARARRLEVVTLATTLFLNRGDHFVAVPLPREAQFATAMAACVGDFDGDGQEDVFLSQNFFATQDKTPRCDAGLGLWLRGDGRGGLTAVPAHESGVRVYGEQRAAALADFDGDGRVDLAVTQNGNATRLFRNLRGQPGLRIRLQGPPGNPTAVGAVMRSQTGDAWGPARMVGAGSGYWSQNSAVEVLAMREPVSRLRVRWPGGNETQVDVPESAREVVLGADGVVRVVRLRAPADPKRR
ncbi:MAG: VCBS repeat-containing protein [Verrucomicrobiales bacterium]|nr:VCBS repeat-containing protein [Verrucomicrobiales bacterium]